MIDDIIDDQKVNKAKNNPKTPSMSDIDPEIPITPKIANNNNASNASFDETVKPKSARMLKSRKTMQIFEKLNNPNTQIKNFSHHQFK